MPMFISSSMRTGAVMFRFRHRRARPQAAANQTDTIDYLIEQFAFLNGRLQYDDRQKQKLRDAAGTRPSGSSGSVSLGGIRFSSPRAEAGCSYKDATSISIA